MANVVAGLIKKHKLYCAKFEPMNQWDGQKGGWQFETPTGFVISEGERNKRIEKHLNATVSKIRKALQHG